MEFVTITSIESRFFYIRTEKSENVFVKLSQDMVEKCSNFEQVKSPVVGNFYILFGRKGLNYRCKLCDIIDDVTCSVYLIDSGETISTLLDTIHESSSPDLFFAPPLVTKCALFDAESVDMIEFRRIVEHSKVSIIQYQRMGSVHLVDLIFKEGASVRDTLMFQGFLKLAAEIPNTVFPKFEGSKSLPSRTKLEVKINYFEDPDFFSVHLCDASEEKKLKELKNLISDAFTNKAVQQCDVVKVGDNILVETSNKFFERAIVDQMPTGRIVQVYLIDRGMFKLFYKYPFPFFFTRDPRIIEMKPFAHKLRLSGLQSFHVVEGWGQKRLKEMRKMIQSKDATYLIVMTGKNNETILYKDDLNLNEHFVNVNLVSKKPDI